MYNVVISFGNYPAYLKNGRPGPYTEEELGLMWIKHVGQFSAPGMLAKYRLVLLLPRDIVIPDVYNLDLDQWGEKKRFDENNKAQEWPVGPNMVFKQVLWLYNYNKLQGPFLWCEPDCIPIKADWLDRLFAEYERAGKPFMGSLIQGFLSNGARVPKHMTGNAIYPDKAYQLAPKLLECHGTAWDVYAASEIIKPANFHETDLIHHELEDRKPPDPDSIASVLYHPDKIGALCIYNRVDRSSMMTGHQSGIKGNKGPDDSALAGGPLMEVLFEDQGAERPVDEMLQSLLKACREDKDVQIKVANFMLENQIVTHGLSVGYLKRRKKEAAAHAESSAGTLATPF